MSHKMPLAIFLILVISFCGCTHSLHVHHVSDFAPTYKSYASGKLVTAKSEQHVVMGWVGQTDYVNQAYDDLISKCPGGHIQGVSTRFSTSHGFFSWTNKIQMEGLCLAQQ